MTSQMFFNCNTKATAKATFLETFYRAFPQQDFHLKLLEEIGIVEGGWKEGKKHYKIKDKKIVEFLMKRKPISAEYRPKPPHEIVLDMWQDMKKRLDKIEQRLEELSRRK